MLRRKLCQESGDRTGQKRPLIFSAGASIEKQQDVVGILGGLEVSNLARLTVFEDAEILTNQIRDGLACGSVDIDVQGNALNVHLDLEWTLRRRDVGHTEEQHRQETDSYAHDLPLPVHHWSLFIAKVHHGARESEFRYYSRHWSGG